MLPRQRQFAAERCEGVEDVEDCSPAHSDYKKARFGLVAAMTSVTKAPVYI